MRAVCAAPLEELGNRGLWLLRPAALVHAMQACRGPRIFKTHAANVVLAAMPPFIPFELTERAVCVVRDPRSIVLSFSKYFSFSTEKTVEVMGQQDFSIGNLAMEQIPMIISSWSNHVRSWASETKFPIHFVKYEDMLEDPLKELRETLEFMGVDFDEERGKRAVEGAKLSKLKRTEETVGFEDNPNPERGKFFNEGGTRWQEELGRKWVLQIEEDHGEVMQELGYKLEYS